MDSVKPTHVHALVKAYIPDVTVREVVDFIFSGLLNFSKIKTRQLKRTKSLYLSPP
ncbi:MAG: hypothetical protein PVG99_09575 [Desulfobacteraceae bacterium]